MYPLQYFLNNILTKAQAMNAAAARSGIPASDVPSEPMKLAMTVVATGPIILLYPFLTEIFCKRRYHRSRKRLTVDKKFARLFYTKTTFF